MIITLLNQYTQIDWVHQKITHFKHILGCTFLKIPIPHTQSMFLLLLYTDKWKLMFLCPNWLGNHIIYFSSTLKSFATSQLSFYSLHCTLSYLSIFPQICTVHQLVLTFTFDNHVNLAIPCTICFYLSYPVFLVYFCLIKKIINNLSAIFKTSILLFISIICIYCICQKKTKNCCFLLWKRFYFSKRNKVQACNKTQLITLFTIHITAKFPNCAVQYTYFVNWPKTVSFIS